MEKISVYMAGPLFSIAARHYNLLLARELKVLGYLVVLPQKEAMRFFDGKNFDLTAVCENCAVQAANSQVVVANIDGTDADSGTALEVGVAYAASGKNGPITICVRTDFRTDMAKEVGYNAMFRLADRFIYMPAYANSLAEVKRFYKALAKAIDKAIKEVFTERASRG